MPRYIDGEVLSLADARHAMKAMKTMKSNKAMKTMKSNKAMKDMKVMLAMRRSKFNALAREVGLPPTLILRKLIDAAIEAMEKQTTTRFDKSGAMTEASAYITVADRTGLKPAAVKAAVEGLFALAAGEINRVGFFPLVGFMTLHRKHDKGIWAERIARITVRCFATKKFKKMVI